MKISKCLIVLSICCYLFYVTGCTFSSRSFVDIVDSVMHVDCVPEQFVIGRRVYKTSDKNNPYDDVYLCLLSGAKEDSLIVFMDINPDDFSLGGPYHQEKDTVLWEKYNCYGDSVWGQERMDENNRDEAPFFFVVILGLDTILYLSDLSKDNHYGFYDAFINEPNFVFRDYKVGKSLKDIPIGKLVGNDVIQRLKNVTIRSCCDYDICAGIKWKHSESWVLSLGIECGVIKRINIYNEGF